MSAHLLVPPSASTSYKWDIVPRNSTIVASSGNWEKTSYNWTPDGGFHNVPWTDGKIAVFDSAVTMTLTENIIAGGLTLNGTAILTKAGTGDLTFNNATIVNNAPSAFTSISWSSGNINITGTYTNNTGNICGLTLSNSAVLNVNESVTVPVITGLSLTTGAINIAAGKTMTCGVAAYGNTYKNVAGSGNLTVGRNVTAASQRFYTNTYTGNTILNGNGPMTVYINGNNPFGPSGTVTISNPPYLQTDTTSPAVTIPNNMVFNANVQIDPSRGAGPSMTFSGVISGTGTCTKFLQGTLNFTNTGNTCTGSLNTGGTSSSTINIASWAGPIVMNVGNINITNSMTCGNLSTSSTTGVLTINSGVTLTVNQTTANTISNVITGAGNLIKAGTNELRINSACTYTGTTTVSAGTLAGSGSITSNVTVQNLARIGGGVSSNGTFTVTGNLIMDAGALIRVNIGGGTTSVVAVTGNVTLNSNVPVFAATALTAGTHRLMSYTGSLTGTLDVPILTGTGRTFSSYTYGAGFIDIVVI